MNKTYLIHHGILGQKWGKLNGPPYPLGASDHSAAEKKEGKTGWSKEAKKDSSEGTIEKKSFNYKKALKIGAIAAGTALAAYGSYKLVKSGALNSIVENGKQITDKISKDDSSDDYWQKLWEEADNSSDIFSEDFLKDYSNFGKNIGGETNPKGLNNNCKDVAEATIKRWTGADLTAIAGENTVRGNLHDFVEARKYNSNGVKWLGDNGSISPDPSGDSTSRVSRQILKNFNDGDCGIVAVTWNSKYLKTNSSEDGHAFNWFIDKGKVNFYDDQPSTPVSDASIYFKKISGEKDIEVVRLSKEAFAK